MGNICSSSQKNCKDGESEVSEGGDNGCQEIEHKPKATNDELVKKDLQDKETVDTPSEVNKTINAANESSTTAPQINCDELEEINNTNAYAKIFGSPISSRELERNKKIVIYILMTDKTEYKQQLNVISKLYSNIWTHCKVKGFELTASFTHHEVLSKRNGSISSQEISTESPLELHAAHEEVANYLAEIERHSHSYIIPLLFLGSSLGAPYIPKRIDKEDFTLLQSSATREQCDILQKFYKLDNHSQPARYTLASTSLRKDEIEQILVILIKLMPINLRDTYLATVVEREITSGLIKTKELAKRCIWIQNGYAPVATVDDSLIQTEMSRRLSNIHEQLRDEIAVKNILRTFATADEQEELHVLLGNAIKSSVDSIIVEHIGKHHRSRNTLGMCRQILAEIESVKRHSMAIGANYDDTCTIDAISRYLHSDSLYPLGIFGKPGAGKSVLAANIAFNLNKWIDNSHLVLRYANLSELSSEITSLLASIAEQVSILVTGRPSPTQHDILQYKRTIERLLESSKIPLVIVIDSVDQIVGVTDFSWLPKVSKPNTKIILTITDTNDLQDNWAANELTKSGVPVENILSLHSKSNKNDKPHANDRSKESRFEAKVISQLSGLGVNNVKEIDTEDAIEKLFKAFETKIDAQFLEILLVIISISTYGIYETDCVNIFCEQTKLDKIYSLIIWSKFCWIVGPMLLHTDRIHIVDSKFRDAILKRYSKNVPAIRRTAKGYYENLPDTFRDLERNLMCLNGEKFSKVPHYDLAILAESEDNTILDQYFSRNYFKDLQWMLNKITSTGCFQYLNDILIAEGKLKANSAKSQHINNLKQFLTLHMAQLNCDGSQLYTLLKIFLKNLISKDASLENNNQVKEWTATIEQLEVTYLECLNNHNPEEITNEAESYNDVVSLKVPGYFIAAMNTEGNEISVWDVPNCKRIRILKCVPQPSLLCSINDFEAAVLCKREIKVIDLNEGLYKATMKGVMNQKMPYFGLHDDSHLVCLSRNRMYVNLMNLQTGDCVTSFKAGEDRFLNSLIVSGNGRILVCGDESQKPFSLLVWHLTQRRLLYDLRIPHHDLFTALSAITFEGSYVTVVAKEIRESGPNFIVVYDLQSGTLFQKLKPVCNTVAIAISQANGCVIAGLENAEILIWDLVTGNCRHTLSGHNAPVTLLKLDPLGSCLLSGDKEGRDLSLRLWELGTGNPLAVFSPSHKTSSCEILDNGIFIILALENVPEVLILRLRNYDKTQIQQSEQYSNDSSDCKIFNLTEN